MTAQGYALPSPPLRRAGTPRVWRDRLPHAGIAQSIAPAARETPMSRHQPLLEDALAHCAADRAHCERRISEFLLAGEQFAQAVAERCMRRKNIKDPMAASEAVGDLGVAIGLDTHPDHPIVSAMLRHGIERYVRGALRNDASTQGGRLARTQERHQRVKDYRPADVRRETTLRSEDAIREPFHETPHIRQLLAIIRDVCKKPKQRLVLYACGENQSNNKTLPMNPSQFNPEEDAVLARVDRSRYESLFYAPEGDHTEVVGTILGLDADNVRQIKHRNWERVYQSLIALGLARQPRISKCLLVAMLRRKKRALPPYLADSRFHRKVDPRFHDQWPQVQAWLRGDPVQWNILRLDPEKEKIKDLDEQGRSLFGALALRLPMAEGGQRA